MMRARPWWRVGGGRDGRHTLWFAVAGAVSSVGPGHTPGAGIYGLVDGLGLHDLGRRARGLRGALISVFNHSRDSAKMVCSSRRAYFYTRFGGSWRVIVTVQ